jgi:enoyl-CoA hydratase/carnithine racemase
MRPGKYNLSCRSATVAAMPEDLVLIDVQDGVAVLTLNRPERLNAWTQALEDRYFDLLEQCAGDPDVRVVVVTGAGRGFCAGADMDDLQTIGSDGVDAARARERRPQTLPLGVPKPIVAAINGPVAGIGLVQAMMTDIRFAAPGAKFTTAFARRGLVAEHGISWILPRLIGHAKALDLLMSGRVFLSEEAAEIGVVNRLGTLDDALEYARDLAANCSPASMAVMKRQVYSHWDKSLGEALAETDRLMLESFERPDFPEGVASFVERREPRFAPYAPAA